MSFIEGITKRRAVSLALFISLTSFLFPFSADDATAAGSGRALYNKATASYERLKNDRKKRRYRDQWERVIKGFDEVARRYPSSPYAGYALYYKAEASHSLYGVSRIRQDLDAALGAYREFVEKSPENEYVPEALNRAGGVALELGDAEGAARLYHALATKHPDSIYAQGARERLKGLPGVEPEVAASGVQGQPAAPGRARVRDIRHWSHDDYTRVVIELEGEFSYKAERIGGPDRIFFDIRGAAIESPLKDGPIAVNDALLRSIRSSQYGPDTVRVVLDLVSIRDYRVLMLPDPPRLVVDVTGRDAATQDKSGPLIVQVDDEVEARGGANKPRLVTVTVDRPEPAKAPDKAPEKSGVEPAPRQNPLPAPHKREMCIATVVIDPGHGGKDSGAVGPTGLKEKDVVLDIALRLKEVVERELGCRVVMTRDTDVFIELDARPMVALRNQADIFVSIHANASRNRRARGIETYLLNTTKDRGIMEVAARENAMAVEKMDAVAAIFTDLALDSKREESLDLAYAVQGSLVRDLREYNRDLVDKDVKQGPFFVLYKAETPSILTEVGFISNRDEENLLASPEYRQKIAEALCNGIKEYAVKRKAPAYEASL